MTAVQKRVGFSSNGKEFGFEVANAINYRNWEPGGEYTKLLKIKNVQLKARKIRYNISGNHFSSAVYPQSLVLRAGTSYTLPITFRPSEKNAYDEFIEFETSDGRFRVPIKAQLPRPDLTLPDALKFGMCAVQDSVTVNFEITNIGNVPTDFSWKFPNGFQVSPNTGHLTPKQTCRLTATFIPQSAIVYHTSAVCTFTADSASSLPLSGGMESSETQELTKSMTLNGIGKFPHVTVKYCSGKSKLVNKTSNSTQLSTSGGQRNESKVSSKAVKILKSDCGEGVMGEECDMCEYDDGEGVIADFGNVAVGSVAKKWIEVTNVSSVSTAFSITPLAPSSSSTTSPSIMIPLFACSDYEGSLQPYSSMKVQLLYSPTLITKYPSIEYFSVKAHGGLGASMVKCVGIPKGPKVCIEESVVTFGNIECGKSSTGIMHIKNDSDVPATFQLQIDASSVFQCDLLSGGLGPYSSHTVIVHFKPLKAIPYCRRVTCLVQHQEPLFVYFIGTATSEMSRPVALQTKHISTFLAHAQNGLSRLPPEQLKQYMDEGRVFINGPNGALVPDAELSLSPPSLITSHTSPYAHYLHYEHEPFAVPHVSIDEEILKFGYCPPNTQSIESKLVCITNHTQGTLQCVWMTMSSDVFLILPEEREIPAGQTVSFSFHFRPEKPSQFYSREIECFVFYKALGDYHSIDPHTVIPPWCLTVRTSGHTFSPTSESFLPKLTFDTKNVVFPPSVPGQPVYRTVLLNNTGDTPILFDIAQDPSQTFSVKPSHGLVEDKLQLFALQMIPKEAKVCNFIASVQLNASDKHKQELLMSGSGELPDIVLDNEEQLFFKPTCIDTISSTTYGVTNGSRLPVKFEWKLSNADRKVLSVHPKSGTIYPNETQRHCWCFSPSETRDYSLKATLHTTLSGGSRTASMLKVCGRGSSGQIQCTPSSLDCGTVIIGTSKQHTLSLFNPSLCDLYYRLIVEQHHEGERDYEENYRGRPFSMFDDGLVELSPVEGVLTARSHSQVKLTVRPSRCLSYHCIIKYQLITNPAATRLTKHPLGPTDTSATSSKELCRLDLCGAYPTLIVSDIQGQGTAGLLSKTTLWNMLSIDEINLHLCDEPSAGELRYAIATRHSMKRRVPVRTRAIVNFDFGAAPVNSESSMVHMMLENKGGVPTEWAFQFPIDMHLEPEYWADTGQLDEIERHELDVINNELFSVSPKRGTLDPGERITIIANFKHTHIGMSNLPVLLKINRGREILLNWQGVTVEHGRPYVHFSSQHHCFDAVPIGIHAYPRQEYTLCNTSDSAVTYSIDTSPLEQLKETNYLMSVLECLQPEGEIPPMSSVPVEFVFSPLESKKYSVDLPIHLSSGDTMLVSFSGEGYDPHSLVDKESEHHTTPTNTIPVHSDISIAGQQAQLSQESITFSDLPLFAAVRRIVFVTNCCEHTLSFQWELITERAKEIVSIQPSYGYIQPGQSAACKITVCSHSSPSYYNLDLLCKVMDESRLLQYQTEFREWARKEEENKHLFTITQTDTTTPHKSPMQRPKSMPKMKALSSVSGKKNSKSRPLSSDSELRGKYHALPPIGSTEETYDEWKKKDLSVKSKTRPRARMASENKPPAPPEPLSLHLGVTAKTLSIPDYASLHDNLDSFYIDQHLLVDSCTENGPLDVGGGEVRVRDEEKDILENILNQMIRELLEDANFHKAVQRVAEEPTPYFTQLASRIEHSPSVQQSTHRHLYAAGLEGIPIDDSHTLHPSSSLTPTFHPSQSQCLVDDTQDEIINDDLVVTSGVSEVRLEADRVGDEGVVLLNDEVDLMEMDAQIKRHLEYRGLVEGILENTILNILKESNAGDFNISAPMYSIAKPSGTETA